MARHGINPCSDQLWVSIADYPGESQVRTTQVTVKSAEYKATSESKSTRKHHERTASHLLRNFDPEALLEGVVEVDHLCLKQHDCSTPENFASLEIEVYTRMNRSHRQETHIFLQ